MCASAGVYAFVVYVHVFADSSVRQAMNCKKNYMSSPIPY